MDAQVIKDAIGDVITPVDNIPRVAKELRHADESVLQKAFRESIESISRAFGGNGEVAEELTRPMSEKKPERPQMKTVRLRERSPGLSEAEVTNNLENSAKRFARFAQAIVDSRPDDRQRRLALRYVELASRAAEGFSYFDGKTWQ